VLLNGSWVNQAGALSQFSLLTGVACY
jgi:hypothetical protein